VKYERDYLQDMLQYLDDVKAFTVDGREMFIHDRKTQLAVIRAYEVIGEIAKRLPESLREANPQIDWRRLINFRDFLAHNYERVLLNNLWAAIEDLCVQQ
jgi:uncharacterized protein with HEPN domain